MNRLTKQIKDQWEQLKHGFTDDIRLEAAEDLAAFFLETATDLAISDVNEMESDDRFLGKDDLDDNL